MVGVADMVDMAGVAGMDVNAGVACLFGEADKASIVSFTFDAQLRLNFTKIRRVTRIAPIAMG